jgi:hypothetical protein
VRRIPLIRREVRESLSPSALELLFAGAELIVEGDRDLARRARNEDRGYATVMVTIDLASRGSAPEGPSRGSAPEGPSRGSAPEGPSVADLMREPADVATAERVAELMRGSALVRRRLIELARPRLADMFGQAARSLRIELLPVVRVSGARILIDGDAVVMLRRAAGGGIG